MTGYDQPITEAAVREDLPAAVLWDMDGTLIDSEPSLIRAQLRLVQEWTGSWTWQEGLSLVGADMRATWKPCTPRGWACPETRSSPV